MRRRAGVVLAVAVLVAGAQQGSAETEARPPGPAGPAVGDLAPDFELTPLRFYDFRVDEREITRGNAWELYEPVRLSDFRGRRPVALVFGSSSSPVRAALPSLEALYRTHGERVQFLFVYIREAAADLRREPQTKLERVQVANHFANAVQLSIPCVVDGMDDAAMQAYAAHPARLVLVDRDGRIALARSGSGRLETTGLDPALSALGGESER